MKTSLIISVTDFVAEQQAEREVFAKLRELGDAKIVDRVIIVGNHRDDHEGEALGSLKEWHDECHRAGLKTTHSRKLWPTGWFSTQVERQDVFDPAMYAAAIAEVKAEASLLGADETGIYTEPHGGKQSPAMWLKDGLSEADGRRIVLAAHEGIRIAGGPVDFTNPTPLPYKLPGGWHYANALHHLGEESGSYASYRFRPYDVEPPRQRYLPTDQWKLAPFAPPVASWQFGAWVTLKEPEPNTVPAWTPEEFIARSDADLANYDGCTGWFLFIHPDERADVIDRLVELAEAS